MNKTIIININGVVFHIEEEAYEVLKSYMTEIKRHFSYSTDTDEIVTDIENRLAEMFNERLARDRKQVIDIQDVQDVIKQMGSVHDIAGETGEAPDDNPFPKLDKKLYRDTEDKNIAGVCAGLAHYFEIDVKWIRLAFVLLFFSGTGVFLYLILWAIVPEAKSRQEKMSMKGEPITLQSFKKNFDENTTLNSGHEDGLTTFVNKIAGLIVAIAKGIVKIVGLIIVLAGSAALLGLILSLFFVLGFWHNPVEFNNFPFNVVNAVYRSPVYFSAFLILVIPLIALVSFAIRVIFNTRFISKTGAFAMLVLWLTGLTTGVYYASRIASDFREGARIEEKTELVNYPTYYLKLNHEKRLSRTDSLRLKLDNTDFKGAILTDDDGSDFSEINQFGLFIEKNESDQAVLVKEVKARGGNFENALTAARNTTYRFEQQDSLIVFDKYLYLNSANLYRGQRVNLFLKIPLNTRLLIENDLDEHLRNYNLWKCRKKDDKKRRFTEWVMTDKGLMCSADTVSVINE